MYAMVDNKSAQDIFYIASMVIIQKINCQNGMNVAHVRSFPICLFISLSRFHPLFKINFNNNNEKANKLYISKEEVSGSNCMVH